MQAAGWPTAKASQAVTYREQVMSPYAVGVPQCVFLVCEPADRLRMVFSPGAAARALSAGLP